MRPFINEWSTIAIAKPINIIVGKNNTGKSQIIGMIKSLCAKSPYQEGIECICTGRLDELSLRRGFPANTSRGRLGGNHWDNHGNSLIDTEVVWHVNSSGQVVSIEATGLDSPYGEDSTLGHLEKSGFQPHYAIETHCHVRPHLSSNAQERQFFEVPFSQKRSSYGYCQFSISSFFRKAI
jgi:hypothetical protein